MASKQRLQRESCGIRKRARVYKSIEIFFEKARKKQPSMDPCTLSTIPQTKGFAAIKETPAGRFFDSSFGTTGKAQQLSVLETEGNRFKTPAKETHYEQRLEVFFRFS